MTPSSGPSRSKHISRKAGATIASAGRARLAPCVRGGAIAAGRRSAGSAFAVSVSTNGLLQHASAANRRGDLDTFAGGVEYSCGAGRIGEVDAASDRGQLPVGAEAREQRKIDAIDLDVKKSFR